MKKTLACLLLCALPALSVGITPPPGWQQQFNLPPGISGQYVSPERRGNFSPNLNLVSKPVDSSLAEVKSPATIAAYMVKTQERMFPMYKVLEKQTRKVGAVEGVLLIAGYAYGDLDLAVYQFAFRHNGVFVTTVFTCLRQDLEAMRPVFEKSLASLKPDTRPAAAAANPPGAAPRP
jgi:hypothetical protein